MGQCNCKANVDPNSAQCSQCADGFWNLTSSNPLGCQGKSQVLVVVTREKEMKSANCDEFLNTIHITAGHSAAQSVRLVCTSRLS